MAENPYDGLVKRLNQFPSGAPDKPELREILKILFTEEEAKLGAVLSLQPFREPVEVIAERVGKDKEEVEKMLDKMAEKGLVYVAPKKGKKCYALLPMVPGIFELQFMKGGTSEREKKLAKLFNDYYMSGWGKEGWSFKVPFARAIPIQEHIPSNATVQPYDQVKHLIENATDMALSYCFCRHEHELLDKSCGRPKDVCMLFGPFVEYAVSHGFAWRATKEEMLAALERAEEAGLIHVSDNIQEKINFICNCCGCCCGILGTITKLGIKDGVARSSYILKIDWDACNNCGACAKRCTMGALTTEGKGKEKKLIFDESICLGCGVCIRACKKRQALRLVERPNPNVPKKTFLELGYSMIAGIQRPQE
jgi:ferredoxin/DNA-binding MarR family transcriptional regulator